MFCIVSRRSRKRDFHPAGMHKVSMRSFAAAIDEPMLFQISDELPNLARHSNDTTTKATSKAIKNIHFTRGDHWDTMYTINKIHSVYSVHSVTPLACSGFAARAAEAISPKSVPSADLLRSSDLRDSRPLVSIRG